MENDNKKIHQCFNCGHFDVYYKKSFYCFCKLDCGFCQKHKLTKNKHESCENWGTNYYNVVLFRKTHLISRLNKAVDEIYEIKQLICENEKDRFNLE